MDPDLPGGMMRPSAGTEGDRRFRETGRYTPSPGTCGECGAEVGDARLHYEWHRHLAAAARVCLEGHEPGTQPDTCPFCADVAAYDEHVRRPGAT